MDADERFHFKAQEFSKRRAHVLSMQDSKNPSASQCYALLSIAS